MVGDVLVKIGADISDFTSGLNRAARDMSSFGDRMSTIGTTAATAFGAIATGGVVAIGATVKAASDFESAFAGVEKVLSGSEQDFAKLAKGIRDMAKEIPASTEEIAKVAEVSGQLGVSKKDLLDFTRTMVDLGNTTNLSAEEAATSIARFSNIMGTSLSDADRLGSVIVDLGNNFAVTESEITAMGMRLAGAGKQIGLSESEVLSFAASLSSLGLTAEAGGSAFSRVFLNMKTATMEGGESLENFAKVAGMSTDEFTKSFEKDAAGAVLSFLKGLDSMNQEGGNTVGMLKDLGLNEIIVRDSLLRASEATNVFSDALKTGTSAWQENSALTEEAAKRYETFASKAEVLWNKIQDIAILIGTPLMEALSLMIEGITPVIDAMGRLAEWFANTNQTFQMFISFGVIIGTVLAALAAGIGIVIAVVGQMMIGFTAVATAVGLTSVALAKVIAIVGGVIAAITAIVGIVVWAYSEFDWFKNTVNAVWDAIKTGVQVAFEFIREIITTVVNAVVSFAGEQLAKFQALWNEHGAAIVAGVKGGFGIIKAVVSGGMSFIKGIFQIVWPQISTIVKIAWGLIKTIVGSAIDIVVGLIDAGMSIMKGDWEGAWDAIKGIGEDIWHNIEEFFKNIDLMEIGKDVIGGFINGISSMADGAIETAKEVGNNIKNTLIDFFDINSPSRVMRDEVGKMIGKGLIEGMDAELRSIQKMAERIAQAATPEQPKLAGFDTGQMRAHTRTATARLQAELSASGSGSGSEVFYEMRDEIHEMRMELRKQKQMIVEMDAREVGRAVERYVTEEQKFNERVRKSFL
ncbi:phage tail tape measure protein [Virgibacillus proomii]|nr:phage tail tape measure protein [Virgibacillus proomii]